MRLCLLHTGGMRCSFGKFDKLLKQPKNKERNKMTEEQKSPTKKKYPPAYEKPYQFRKGQEVKIAFLDGKTITGSVYQFSKYHIVLELDTQ